MKREPAAGEAGFTLLEIIVALVVLGVLLVTLSQGVHFGFAAWAKQDRALRQGEALAATDRTLRRLIEQMEPGTPRDAGRLKGHPNALAFTSTLPIGADGAMSEADISLMVDGDGRLILSWLPHLHAQRLQPPPPPHVSVLLGHVASLQLAYWSDTTAQWASNWTDNALPDLIRIRLRFDEADGRRWPDIVAAPIREPPPGG